MPLVSNNLRQLDHIFRKIIMDLEINNYAGEDAELEDALNIVINISLGQIEEIAHLVKSGIILKHDGKPASRETANEIESLCRKIKTLLGYPVNDTITLEEEALPKITRFCLNLKDRIRYQKRRLLKG